MDIYLVIDNQFTKDVNEAQLRKAAETVLAQHQTDPLSELTVVIDSDAKLQELNLQFLGIDAPTDVLSFPADEMDPDSQQHYLGDIIISLPRAREQALAAGETLEDELQLLVVHGTLHLLGYDHGEPEDKIEMWKAQRSLLDSLGCRIQHLPE